MNDKGIDGPATSGKGVARADAAGAPVALVTGGARRIGAALVRGLHRSGYRVLIHYRSSAAEADALAAELNRERSDSARCLQADLESIAEAQALGAAARESWGRVDVLVNNASDFYPTPLEAATAADWQRLMGSNLQGPFFLIQALLAELRSRSGTVVNLIDIHASRPLAEHPIYCAAKAGLLMLTRALARDLGPGIRVNGIAPGSILWPEPDSRTALASAKPPSTHESSLAESSPTEASMDQAAFTDIEQGLIDRIPARRMGTPEDIVRTALFLIDDAPYITGQIIAVDGGRSQI